VPATPHWLRHTYITERRDAGWSFDQIANVVGHLDPDITRRVYTEIRPRVYTA
jgi:integrase